MELPCPYLDKEVDLTDERIAHIEENHPGLIDNFALIRDTLSNPDLVTRRSRSSNVRLISRWFPNLLNGKWVIVVVVTHETPKLRHWIVTAHLSTKTPRGEVEWQRI